MDLIGLTSFRLRRVNPYRGLVIDEATWAEAHDYHRDHLRLHALAFHSPGVIAGLDVRPTPSQAGSVDISPGVALDPEGNMVVVSQDRRVPLDDVEAGDVYLVLSYLENRVNAESGAPRGAPANRIVESYKIEAQNMPPEEPGIELARVHWSSVDAALKQAADVSNPGPDELDMRFREAAHVARPATINVGVVSGAGNPDRLLGLSNLLREIDGLSSYQARFRGNVNLEDGAGGSDLLYLSAPVDSEAAVTTLASHIGHGGALLADACGSKGENAFAGSVQHLAERLGLRLKPIKPNDELLNTRYPFAEPPAGANDGPIVASGRFVFSQRDYGCAWSSACEKTVLPRETVRAALEWGVNLAVASVQPLARGA
jgi:Domain of unknown function (DUF4159)